MTKEEAIKEIDELRNDIGSTYDDADQSPMWYALGMAIDALQKRKTGKWMSENGNEEVPLDEEGNTTRSCICSVCGDWLTASDEYPTRGRYCPNCGVKMVKEGTDESTDSDC